MEHDHSYTLLIVEIISQLIKQVAQYEEKESFLHHFIQEWEVPFTFYHFETNFSQGELLSCSFISPSLRGEETLLRENITRWKEKGSNHDLGEHHLRLIDLEASDLSEKDLLKALGCKSVICWYGLQGSDQVSGYVVLGIGNNWDEEKAFNIGVKKLSTLALKYYREHHISFRKRAHQDFFYEEMINSSSEAIFLHDGETGEILFVNKGFEKLYGFSLEEALTVLSHPKNFNGPPYGLEEALEWMEKAKKTPQTFEWWAKKKSGEKFWVEVSLRHFELNGKSRFLAVVRDINERKKDLKKLEMSEKKFRRIFENIQDIYFEVDGKGCIEEVSPSFNDIFQIPYSKVIGRSINEQFEVSPSLKKIARHLLCSNKVENLKLTLSSSQSNKHYLSMNAVLLKGKKGEGKRIVGSLRDITQSRQYEEQLQQSQKIEAIGTLAGGIAHDFNNIITSIMGSADLILSELSESHPYYRRIKEIRQTGLRASKLTQQLLAFGRKQKLIFSYFDINELTMQTERMLRSLIRENILIQNNYFKSPLVVKGDQTQIEQVFLNIAINASDAMERGGCFFIQTEESFPTPQFLEKYPQACKQKYVKIIMQDTGIGMGEDIQKRIFDPFFTTKPKGKGTGLGLSMASGIIEQHGGFIEVESKEGEGTLFTIYLPLSKEAKPKKQISQKPKLVGGNEEILIVEDEDVVRDIMKQTLEKMGYHVYATGDSLEAYSYGISRGEKLRLLITDMIMPGMSGKALSLKFREHYPNLPILIISGYNEENLIPFIENFPRGEYLQKPFSIQMLIKKVRQLLDCYHHE